MSRRWRVLCLILRVIVKMRGMVNKSREKMKLYCCRLFPNDFEFERETLVRLWMAMGFSSQSCIEKFCERYFDTLIEEQYLIFTSIDVKTGRKLYKFNHHGKDNMGEKKTVYNEDFYTMLEDEEANGSKPGHISLVSSCINETTFKKLQKFDGELRTLLFIYNYGSSLNKIPSDMFLSLEFLRALDLSGSDIFELPRSIGNLRQLRYLDLSFTLIESLPESIDQLHQLQTLKLQGCKHLHELPKEIKELICLRHLDLDVLGQLTFLPKGIGALTELCTLSAFLVDSEEGCSIRELKFLNKLKGSLCISGLENVALVDDVQEAALQDKKYVTQLQLRWSDRISYSNEDKQLGDNIIASLNLNRGLQDLQIVSYPGSDTPAWVDFREQRNLSSITLLNCNNNDLSLPLGQLPNLKYLSIIHMNWVTKIKGWSHEDGDEAYVAFPKLEKLEIECMFILETWIDEFKHGDFPFLSTLIIKQCPKLTRLPFLPHLQVLKHLEMSHCPEFKCFPDGALSASLETLIIDGCPDFEKRCSEEGEDWHKVKHIPNIWIDLQEDSDEDSSSTIDICSIDEDVSEDIKLSAEDSLQAMSKYPPPYNIPHVEDSVENNKLGAHMGSSFLPTYPDEYNGVQPTGLDYVSIAQGGPVAGDNQFRTLDMASWEEDFQQCTIGSENLPANPLTSVAPFVGSTVNYNENFSQLLDAGFGVNPVSGDSLAPYLLSNNSLELSSTDFQDNTHISATAKQPLLGNIKAEEGLQKVEGFSKWMTKELAGVDDLHLKSSSNLSWQNIEATTTVDDPSVQLDNYSMSPSIGQDQLFDIQDFSPSCASTDGETKVMITGRFLVTPSEAFKYNWSCMFGEVEVPADVLANDVLCCYAPSHSAGQVPFYVTCSNRFACSQVREFEYLEEIRNENICGNSMMEKQLCHRLQKLLSLRSPGNFDRSESIRQKEPIFRKILLLMDDELCRGVEQQLKEKVVSWLFDKVSEDGKGPSILDEEGQGLLHLAAALGYDWIIPPTLAAGVTVNFRDINGWTALHWAAFYGREETVALLVALEAASGALTDPSPKFPLGRTAADLASANGYKGISGFLGEHSITEHPGTLTMSDQKVDNPVAGTSKAVQTKREKVATPGTEGDGSDLSLKDSLAAVRNATQAADRIHQVFRMQSFQRKQVIKGAIDDDDDESLLNDEQFLSLVSSKIQRPGHPDDQFHSAAITIQKIYRGWKKRKELTILERVVRIQAQLENDIKMLSGLLESLAEPM